MRLKSLYRYTYSTYAKFFRIVLFLLSFFCTQIVIKKITFFKNLNLIHKFLLTYCILILVPLTTLFGYTYTKMSQIIESNILDSTKQAFDQSIDFLTYKIYRIFDISNSLAIDENITNILRNDPDSYLLSNQIGDLAYLRLFLSAYENDSDVSNISLYVNNNFNT